MPREREHVGPEKLGLLQPNNRRVGVVFKINKYRSKQIIHKYFLDPFYLLGAGGGDEDLMDAPECIFVIIVLIEMSESGLQDPITIAAAKG